MRTIHRPRGAERDVYRATSSGARSGGLGSTRPHDCRCCCSARPIVSLVLSPTSGPCGRVCSSRFLLVWHPPQVIDDKMTMSYTVTGDEIDVEAVFKGNVGWLGFGMCLSFESRPSAELRSPWFIHLRSVLACNFQKAGLTHVACMHTKKETSVSV